MVAIVRRFFGLVMILPLLASIISCSSSSSGTTGISYTMDLSPAAASVAAGMQIPITLTMTGPDQRVTWKLNNIDSGSAVGLGTITTIPGSTSVFYKAPDVIPPTGSTVTITAVRTSPSSSISSTITIVGAPGYTNFTTAGTMLTPRYSHTATLLSTGNILVAGGFSNVTSLNSAELCTEGPLHTATFTAKGNMSVPRAFHTATLLLNGNVLIAGGSSAKTPSGVPLASAEIYNYITGTFSGAGSMKAARIFHTATILQNGKVLITGGKDASGNDLSTAEIYDPTAGTAEAFANVSPMNKRRSGHTATLLSTGDVLIVGGGDASGEIFHQDSITGTVTFTTVSGIADITGHTATLRNNFDVLITGGTSVGVPQSAGYLYSGSSFSAVGSMSSPRIGHAAALLAGPTGDVLLTGGDSGTGAVLASVDKFSGSAFSATPPPGPMITPRAKHTATTLFNGNVVIIGGFNTYSSNVTLIKTGTAEILR